AGRGERGLHDLRRGDDAAARRRCAPRRGLHDVLAAAQVVDVAGRVSRVPASGEVDLVGCDDAGLGVGVQDVADLEVDLRPGAPLAGGRVVELAVGVAGELDGEGELAVVDAAGLDVPDARLGIAGAVADAVGGAGDLELVDDHELLDGAPDDTLEIGRAHV